VLDCRCRVQLTPSTKRLWHRQAIGQPGQAMQNLGWPAGSRIQRADACKRQTLRPATLAPAPPRIAKSPFKLCFPLEIPALGDSRCLHNGSVRQNRPQPRWGWRAPPERGDRAPTQAGNSAGKLGGGRIIAPVKLPTSHLIVLRCRSPWCLVRDQVVHTCAERSCCRAPAWIPRPMVNIQP